MNTLFVQNDPVVDDRLAERRRLGHDRRDEVYRVVPHEHGRNGVVTMQVAAALHGPALTAGRTPGGSFNLGAPHDVRVPDLGFPADAAPQRCFATAVLVVEVLSPQDETFAKSTFCAACGVEELWLVDPLEQSVRIWQRAGDGWDEAGRSDLLDLTVGDVIGQITWPQG